MPYRKTLSSVPVIVKTPELPARIRVDASNIPPTGTITKVIPASEVQIIKTQPNPYKQPTSNTPKYEDAEVVLETPKRTIDLNDYEAVKKALEDEAARRKAAEAEINRLKNEPSNSNKSTNPYEMLSSAGRTVHNSIVDLVKWVGNSAIPGVFNHMVKPSVTGAANAPIKPFKWYVKSFHEHPKTTLALTALTPIALSALGIPAISQAWNNVDSDLSKINSNPSNGGGQKASNKKDESSIIYLVNPEQSQTSHRQDTVEVAVYDPNAWKE